MWQRCFVSSPNSFNHLQHFNWAQLKKFCVTWDRWERAHSPQLLLLLSFLGCFSGDVTNYDIFLYFYFPFFSRKEDDTGFKQSFLHLCVLSLPSQLRMADCTCKESQGQTFYYLHYNLSYFRGFFRNIRYTVFFPPPSQRCHELTTSKMGQHL